MNHCISNIITNLKISHTTNCHLLYKHFSKLWIKGKSYSRCAECSFQQRKKYCNALQNTKEHSNLTCSSNSDKMFTFNYPMKVKIDTKKTFILLNTNCECLQKLEHVFNWRVRKWNMYVFQTLAMFPFPVNQLNYFLRGSIQIIPHSLLKQNSTTWLFFIILRKNKTTAILTN
jgi:hypothetical protein